MPFSSQLANSQLLGKSKREWGGRMFSGIPGCDPLDANRSPTPTKNTSRHCQSFAGVQGGGVLNFKTSLLKHYLILTSIKETSSERPVFNSIAKKKRTDPKSCPISPYFPNLPACRNQGSLLSTQIPGHHPRWC